MKEVKRVSWYKPYDSVLFCPPTPQSELFKQLNEVAQETKNSGGMSIKVIERAGRRLNSLMPGLRVTRQCLHTDCFVHSNGGQGDCDVEGVVYRGKCIACEENNVTSTYIGETSRSAYVRGRQHMAAIHNASNCMHNAFARHMIEYHPHQDPKFRIDIIGKYKSALERQIAEGVEIFNMTCDIPMNSKLDHYQPAFSRIRFTNPYP